MALGAALKGMQQCFPDFFLVSSSEVSSCEQHLLAQERVVSVVCS